MVNRPRTHDLYHAFLRAATRVIEDPRPVLQPKLVKRVVSALERLAPRVSA